jgi:hypothetical protein
MLTFSEVGNTEAHETKRRTSQPDSGLATIPTRRFWPCIIVGGMDTNMGDLDSFCHEVFPSEDWKAGTIEGFGFPYPDSSSTPLSQPNPAACLLGSTVFSRARASIEPQRLKIEGRERGRLLAVCGCANRCQIVLRPRRRPLQHKVDLGQVPAIPADAAGWHILISGFLMACFLVNQVALKVRVIRLAAGEN